MDLYLETLAFWSDFHARFIYNWSDALADILPEQYEARIDEKVRLVEVNPSRRKLIEPDVALMRRESSNTPPPAPAGVATLEPVTLTLDIEEEERHERWIEILHRPERSVVAVLELLSPTNKEEPGRGDCIAKRNALLRHPIHLVELDLLIGGRRLPPENDLPGGDYYVLVSRGERRPECQAYAWRMRQPLPAIPIPLLPPDPDVWVDLAAVFAVTYERGRYARDLDYTAPPPITLDDETRTWVMQQLQRGNGRV
jgi:hypothetical protein